MRNWAIIWSWKVTVCQERYAKLNDQPQRGHLWSFCSQVSMQEVWAISWPHSSCLVPEKLWSVSRQITHSYFSSSYAPLLFVIWFLSSFKSRLKLLDFWSRAMTFYPRLEMTFVWFKVAFWDCMSYFSTSNDSSLSWVTLFWLLYRSRFCLILVFFIASYLSSSSWANSLSTWRFLSINSWDLFALRTSSFCLR